MKIEKKNKYKKEKKHADQMIKEPSHKLYYQYQKSHYGLLQPNLLFLKTYQGYNKQLPMPQCHHVVHAMLILLLIQSQLHYVVSVPLTPAQVGLTPVEKPVRCQGTDIRYVYKIECCFCIFRYHHVINTTCILNVKGAD